MVMRIDAHLTQKVKEEGAHYELIEAVQERVVNDQIEFAKLAKGYKTKPGGAYTLKPSLRRSKAYFNCA